MQVWSGTVTVGTARDTFLNSTLGHGFYRSTGSLDDKTFTTGSNDYTIDALWVETQTATNRLRLSLTSTRDLTTEATADLQLHLCNEASELSCATRIGGSDLTYMWNDDDLDWSFGTSRTLNLTVDIPNTPTTGAPALTGSARAGRTGP